MKLASFFKILNRKIEKYEKFTTNPFEFPQSVTLIWVEEIDNKLHNDTDD